VQVRLAVEADAGKQSAVLVPDAMLPAVARLVRRSRSLRAAPRALYDTCLEWTPAGGHSRTQFACFTGTKLQILTQLRQAYSKAAQRTFSAMKESAASQDNLKMLLITLLHDLNADRSEDRESDGTPTAARPRSRAEAHARTRQTPPASGPFLDEFLGEIIKALGCLVSFGFFHIHDKLIGVQALNMKLVQVLITAIHIYIHTYVWIHTCIHKYIRIDIHTYTTLTYIYIYTYETDIGADDGSD
jgi:hypothetical protein